MKAVMDTMLWVSYCTRRDGVRHRLIERALKARVRLFVSDYILDELAEVLIQKLGESERFAHLAQRAVLRRAKRVILPQTIRGFVAGDPKDDASVQTDGDFLESGLPSDSRHGSFGATQSPGRRDHWCESLCTPAAASMNQSPNPRCSRVS